jgi:hypothetical protein
MDWIFAQVLVGAAVAGFVQGLSGFAFGAAALPHLNATMFKAGVGLLLTVYC